MFQDRLVNKFKIFAFVLILIVYLGWTVYKQNGWTLIVGLEALCIVCTVLGTQSSFFIKDQLLKKYDSAFILASVFIVSAIFTGAFNLSNIFPSNGLFDLQTWYCNPLKVLFGWFNWWLGITALVLACSNPNKPHKQN